jgi:hypothetical protein
MLQLALTKRFASDLRTLSDIVDTLKTKLPMPA